MVRFQQQQQHAVAAPPPQQGGGHADNDADAAAAASVQAYLSQFGSVDRYLTSVQDYLPHFGKPGEQQAPDAAAAAAQVARQAHAAVLQQLAGRTPQLLDGTQLYAQIEASRIMPLGCHSLDNMLSGGLRETTVTEIAGETCSGKTQLCHLAAVMTAQRSEPVLYFDTTNAFSADRARQMIEFSEPEGIHATLTNITVVRCHSIHALLASLDDIGQRTGSSDAPKLIIVDSMSALLSPVIGATQHNQGHVLVAETARLLRHTASALQCSVLVTNHVVGAGGSFAAAGGREEGGAAAAAGGAGGSSRAGGVTASYKPALGEQWRAAAHVRLQLSRAAGGAQQDLACATLLTHPMQAPGAQAWFRLDRALSSQ